MIDYSIDLDAGPVVRKLKKIGADMDKINRVILSSLSEEVITNAQQVYIRGGGGPPGGSFVKYRTGKLAQSLNYVVRGDYALVGSKLKYARIHEEGGTIHAKGKKLAIPIGTYKGSPRQHADLKLTIRGDTAFLMDTKGRMQYVLKDSVTIPKRPYLRPALDNLFKSGRAQMIADKELQRELDRRMAG